MSMKVDLARIDKQYAERVGLTFTMITGDWVTQAVNGLDVTLSWPEFPDLEAIVDWGDGSDVEAVVAPVNPIGPTAVAPVSHTYAGAGTYTVEVSSISVSGVSWTDDITVA